MLEIHAGNFNLRLEDCRRSAAVAGIIFFIVGFLIMVSYFEKPLHPIDAYFFKPPLGSEAETIKVCDQWTISDAFVAGGKRVDGNGCRVVPVFNGGDEVMLHREVIWNHLCKITASDSWEPGPGNPVNSGIKHRPLTVPTPRGKGLMSKSRETIIPKLTKGLWGHVANDDAVCWPWQWLWPITVRPMVTEFYVKG